MAEFGGEIRIKVSTGEIFKTRGDITTEPTRYTNTAVVNNDGSASKTVELKTYKLGLTLEHDIEVDYDALMKHAIVGVDLIEDYTGRIQSWTGGFFTGTPEINNKNGEVTGLMVEAAQYKQAQA